MKVYQIIRWLYDSLDFDRTYLHKEVAEERLAHLNRGIKEGFWEIQAVEVDEREPQAKE